MRKFVFSFSVTLLTLFLSAAPAFAGKTRLLTDTSTSAITVPFINAGPADDATAATALGLQVNGSEYMRLTATGSVGIGIKTPRVSLDLGGMTDSLLLPTGTTGQRPATGVAGMMRYNSTSAAFEGYNGSAWSSLAGSTGTGTSGQSIFSGWPDVIVCNVTTPNQGAMSFMVGDMPFPGTGLYYYYPMNTNVYSWSIAFNANGTFNNYSSGITASSCNVSISTLIANGQAFNLANGGSNGAASMADGTAGAPGLYFSANTNTGLYRPTASAIGFATNGTEAMRITGTGSVGIGTTTPAEKLDLGGGNIKMGVEDDNTITIATNVASQAWSPVVQICTTGKYVIGGACWATATNGMIPPAYSGGAISAFNSTGSTSSVACSVVCANIR